MTDWPREVFVDLSTGVRIRYCRSEQPPVQYAISLETHVDGQWTTIRLWDNAHDVNEHHEHEYTRRQGKRDPTLHPFRSINEAMAAAMTRAAQDWQAFLNNWEAR